MAQEQSKRVVECTYCGELSSLTEDHIPAKCLFPKPRPSNPPIPRVWSCRGCNSGLNGEIARDDEYFRDVLVLRADAGYDPKAEQVGDVVLRSFGRSEAKGKLRTLLSNTEEVEIQSEGGLFLGTTGLYQVDQERITRVVRRIVRGLFFYHFQRRVPVDYEVTTQLLADVDPSNPEQVDSCHRIVTILQEQRIHKIGTSEFEYRFTALADCPDCTFWLMRFYQSVVWLGATVPPKTSELPLG